ncbi:MAG: M14 family metallopeptidase [Flavobacteriaceae bacterium]|nr:M14 family metallopeptidase [Flavobacteriaceae bacterium]
MKTLFLALSVFILLVSCKSVEDTSKFDFETQFEKSEGTQTATYDQVIEFYQNLSDAYTTVAMYEMGPTDSGEDLNLVTFNPNRSFESEFRNREDKVIILINNGIHPGESDGIDASMMLLRDLAEGKIKTPENAIVAVIPIYNIGGALNRNTGTRTNQNGPEEYGFRGNARNYDLNRDFIKADTKNARSFAKLFNIVKPDLFIDNHVSNGADYQYTLTHLFTQHNKIGGNLGKYINEQFMPQLEDSLQQKEWDITPYVNVFNRSPEKGFSQFMDYPRYSTGYTTLFNTVGMMVETHMLKPYKQRVEGTYELMKSFINIADRDTELIRTLRKTNNTQYNVGSQYPIQWKIDSSQTSTINFKGYEASMEKSKITGANRLKYDTTKPFTKEVIYYDHYTPTRFVTVPSHYIIPKGYWDVIDRLDRNDIDLERLKKDTTLIVQVYKIKDYKTFTNPYEGHYPHYNTKIELMEEEITAKVGDIMVNTQQRGLRYILETLEPEARDSFFNWNYFDTRLQQKEGFSPYVWEDMAEQFLKDNPSVETEFKAKLASEPEFARNWFAQLDWIHKQSPNYEEAHLRYPIVRVGG